jgi:hypothetical protein
MMSLPLAKESIGEGGGEGKTVVAIAFMRPMFVAARYERLAH